MSSPRIVVAGASAGGVVALQALASQLGPDFPAPLLVVQHIGKHTSILPDLLVRRAGTPASHAAEGDEPRAGHIHVAPPDRHMFLKEGRISLSHGPRENHARPAIDPLFRSAAAEYGTGVIGVLLTGHLDDGTAGLQAIKARGGIAVVQHPSDAESPSMPASAMRYVEVDHAVPLQEMGALLHRLVAAPAPPPAAGIGASLTHEIDLMLNRGDPFEHLGAIGRPSTFVCPDCSGALWEIAGSQPRRYRCHTGHGFTLRSLQHAQAEGADEALWSAFRALQEKEILLRSLASAEAAAQVDSAHWLREADQVSRHAEALRRLIERVPTSPE